MLTTTNYYWKKKCSLTIYLFDFILGVNTLLVPIFWVNFYFGPYILILLLLVPKMKNVFHFCPYCYSLNENC